MATPERNKNRARNTLAESEMKKKIQVHINEITKVFVDEMDAISWIEVEIPKRQKEFEKISKELEDYLIRSRNLDDKPLNGESKEMISKFKKREKLTQEIAKLKEEKRKMFEKTKYETEVNRKIKTLMELWEIDVKYQEPEFPNSTGESECETVSEKEQMKKIEEHIKSYDESRKKYLYFWDTDYYGTGKKFRDSSIGYMVETIKNSE